MIFLKAESYRAVQPGPCVLLDGCFDPVHHGHIKYIRAAKVAYPDHQIVVGVASDADVRGKGREPLFGQMTRCAIVDAMQGVDVVIARDGSLSDLVTALKPDALVKGKDWEGKLDIPGVVYLGNTLDSSTDRLRHWAAAEDAKHLEQLEQIVQSQKDPEPWTPVTDYSFEARKEIEGQHPQLILEAFQPKSILDVGCGPGHLVRMLRDLGASDVDGMDVAHYADLYAQEDITDPMLREMIGWSDVWDLVICREVLEHVPLREIPQAVANLCQLARRFVYVTTRFTKAPAHLLKVDTADELDPTHITMLNQDFLRALFVLNGGKRRKDLETKLDHMGKGRVLVYEV